MNGASMRHLDQMEAAVDQFQAEVEALERCCPAVNLIHGYTCVLPSEHTGTHVHKVNEHTAVAWGWKS